MNFTNEVKNKYKLVKALKKVIAADNKVYFEEHPDVEFPKELIDMGFKDDSWHNDETGFATKKINSDLWVGVWVFNKGDKNTKHRFFVVTIPVNESGDYDSSTSKDLGSADTINELKNLINKIKVNSDARFGTSTGQYDVYVMSEDEGKEAGRTVPTEYALKRSKRTNKKIKLTITEYKDTTKNIANALKLAGLIDRSATGEDIQYDGNDNEMGVWYKDIYRFTLVKDSTSTKVHSMDNLDKLEFSAKQVNTNLSKVADELKKAGIEITEILEADMDTDALIGLKNNYYLQIGHGYICLNISSGEGDDYGVREISHAKTVKEIIPKIKKYIP